MIRIVFFLLCALYFTDIASGCHSFLNITEPNLQLLQLSQQLKLTSDEGGETLDEYTHLLSHIPPYMDAYDCIEALLPPDTNPVSSPFYLLYSSTTLSSFVENSPSCSQDYELCVDVMNCLFYFPFGGYF